MVIKNLSIKFDSARWNDGKVGIGAAADPTAGYKYVRLTKDNDIEVRDNTNAVQAQIDGQNVATCTDLLLEVPEDDHEVAALLLNLRLRIGNETGAQSGAFVMIKNLDDTKIDWDTKTANTLKIKNVSLDDIVIDDMDTTAGSEPKINDTDSGDRLGNDLSEWRKGFFEVADLLKKDYSTIPEKAELDEDLAILNDCTDVTTTGHSVAVNTLTTQQGEKTTAEENERRLIRSFVYWLTKNKADDNTVGTVGNWKGAIDALKKRIKEITIAKEIIGLTSIDELLMLNAGGFTIHGNNRDGTTVGTISVANPLDFTTQNAAGSNANKTVKFNFSTPRIYLGFDIIDLMNEEGKVKIDKHPHNDDNTHIFGKRVIDNGTKITKNNIDRFRTGLFGTDDKYKDESDPKKLRGFRLGDIGTTAHTTAHATGFDIEATTKIVVAKGYKTATDNTHGNVDGTDNTTEYKVLTKICFDILDKGRNNTNPENNLGDVIRAAFTENDFEEVDDEGPKQILELYWKVIKAAANTHLFHSGTNNSNYDNAMKLKMTNDKTPLTDVDEKAIVKQLENLEAVHTYVETFINDVLVNVPTKEADFNAWEEKVKAYKKTGHPAEEEYKNELAEFWRSGSIPKLDVIISNVKAKLVKDDKEKSDELSSTNQTELTGFLTSKKDPAKKIYTAFNGLDKDKKTNKAYEALKELIDKLETTSSWDDKPKSLKKDYEDSTNNDKKTAWEFVNEQTKDDDTYKNDKGWANYIAKEKEAKLTSAIAKAKTKMSDESGADASIGMDSQESIKVVNEIGNLFELCKKVHDGKVSSSDLGDAKKNLTAFKDTAGDKQEAWNAVNKYKKDSKEYATEALAKASKEKKERDGKFGESLKLATVEAAKEFFDKNTSLDSEDRSRSEAFIALKNETSVEAKLLSKVLEKNDVSEYSESSDKLDESIKEIEKHIDILDKIIKAKSSDTDTLGKIKKVLEEIKNKDSKFDIEKLKSWKTKLEARKKALEAKKNTEEKTGRDTPEKKWYGEWWGIMLIIFAVLAIVGGIAWLIKANSSEEGEGESE